MMVVEKNIPAIIFWPSLTVKIIEAEADYRCC